MKYPQLWFVQDILTKPQHYLYPQSKGGVGLHQRIMILVTLRGFLYIPEDTSIEPKEFINKGCVKPFQKGHLELDNGLISYYDTPRIARVIQLRLRVVPVKFIQVVISECHVSPLSGHIHDHRTLLMVLARFWWTMVNKEMVQFIITCANCQ